MSETKDTNKATNKKPENSRLLPAGVFDTHAHYTDDRFAAEFEGGADAAISGCFAEGMSGIINVGTNIDNSKKAVAQAAKYPLMYAAVGIHPSDIGMSGGIDAELEAIAEMISEKQVRRQNKIVALGEVGLDHHWQPYDDALQKRYLDAQLSMARELDIPVIIHDREAHGDCFDAILAHRGVRGVFHSYSGSAEMALELCRRGFYISFSGTLTFKNARHVRSVAEELPRDRILIETDCPYLAPEPYRGHLNYSAYAVYTAKMLGELLAIDTREAAELTAKNARELFLESI